MRWIVPLLSLLLAVPAWAQFKMPDQRALGVSANKLKNSTYATVVNTNAVSITPTCTSRSGSHPSRDVIWQVLSGATTYTTPAASVGCAEGDVIEAFFIQADNGSNQVTVADGAGTTHTGTLFAVPPSTGAGQGRYLWVEFTYHANIAQWSMGGQTTNPATPVPVAQGGTQCGTPTTFSGLPAKVQGEVCTITDAPACNSGSVVSAGGGSKICQLWTDGTSWYPGGGSTAAAGGAGTTPQLAYYASTGSTSVGASNSSWNNSTSVLSLGSNPPALFGSGQHGVAAAEGTCPAGTAGADELCASSSHQWQSSLNGGSLLEVPQIIASGTSALGTGAVTNGTCATTVTTAATGAVSTDTIVWSHNAAVTGGTNGSLIIHAYPTSGNVNFQECNPTAGSITPPADTLNWKVIR